MPRTHRDVPFTYHTPPKEFDPAGSRSTFVVPRPDRDTVARQHGVVHRSQRRTHRSRRAVLLARSTSRERYSALVIGVVQTSAVSDDFYCDRVMSGIEAIDVVHEDDTVVAYHHTRPFFAEAHIVVVPKQHVGSLLDPAADAVLPELLKVVRQVAAQVLERHGATRVLTNLGRYQDSKHLHWHVCAGSETGGGVARPPTGLERRLHLPT